MGGHQRAQIRQICEQIGRVAQGNFLFVLETLEGADGVPQVREHFPRDLRLNALPDQQKAQGCEPGSDEDH